MKAREFKSNIEGQVWKKNQSMMSVNMEKLGSKVTEMADSSDQAGAV